MGADDACIGAESAILPAGSDFVPESSSESSPVNYGLEARMEVARRAAAALAPSKR